MYQCLITVQDHVSIPGMILFPFCLALLGWLKNPKPAYTIWIHKQCCLSTWRRSVCLNTDNSLSETKIVHISSIITKHYSIAVLPWGYCYLNSLSVNQLKWGYCYLSHYKQSQCKSTFITHLYLVLANDIFTLFTRPKCLMHDISLISLASKQTAANKLITCAEFSTALCVQPVQPQTSNAHRQFECQICW